MEGLLRDIDSFNEVHYLNYRIALKLRCIQRTISFDSVPVELLHELLVSQPGQADNYMPYLERFLAELYNSIQGTSSAKELCSNVMLMAFNCLAGERLTRLKVEVFTHLFSSLAPQEKARYLYISMASFDGIRKKSFELLLQIISQILKSIGELLHYPSEKVLENYNEEQFVQVMIGAAPFKWFSIWHKLKVGEHALHQVECSCCHEKPMAGLRYRCLQCASAQFCQWCYLRGKVNSVNGHLETHITQEIQSSQWLQRTWHQKLFCVAPGNESKGCIMNDIIQPFVRPEGPKCHDLETPQSTPGLSRSGLRQELIMGSPSAFVASVSTSSPLLNRLPGNPEVKKQFYKELSKKNKYLKKELQGCQDTLQHVTQVECLTEEEKELKSNIQGLLAKRQHLACELEDLVDKVHSMKDDSTVQSHVDSTVSSGRSPLKRSTSLCSGTKGKRRQLQETLV